MFNFPNSKPNSMNETASLSVMFGIVWTIAAGLLVWCLRIPVMGHTLSLTAVDIIRAVILTTALILILPLAANFSKRTGHSVVVAQAGFWGLIFILWLLRMMASIAFDLIVLGVVVIGLLKLFDKATIRNWSALWISFAAILMSIFHIFLLMETGYSHPLAVEAALLGQQHRDTLFHASIAAFLSKSGVPSSGYDGIVELSYHILSHHFVSGLSDWTNVVPLNGYVLFLTIMGGPLLITQLFWTSAVIGSLPRRETTVSLSIIEILIIILFFGELAIKSFWLSESYIVSLWALLGALAIMGTSKPAKLFDLIIVIVSLAILVFIASLAKISTGAVLACGVAAYLFSLNGFRLQSLLVAALVGFIPFVIVMILAPVDSGHADETFIKPFATLMQYTGRTTMYIIFVAIFFSITFRYLGRDKNTLPVQLAIWTIMLASIACSMIIYLEGASALYFADPAIWAGLCLLSLFRMKPIWIGRNRILRNSLVGLALIVVAYSLGVSGWNGLSKYQNNLEQIEKFNTGKDPSNIVAALPLGKIVLSAFLTDGVFVPPSVKEFWKISPQCWSTIQVVPAISSTPLLMGLPSSESGCVTSRFYGFGEYSQITSAQQEMNDHDVCARAKERNMRVISVVQPDLSVRKLVCAQ